eukprot:CAMPEP_0176409866 /NCGR_PEP_ID=MMETSP0127-20121128/2734_1 /TAXON_ID=938130 /ORGANISM="Platyophrya macrostoma, Strain WH" /LENGTH=45 /DNA_ID= /DNA_START= /DNA_END= /DNA_ORIENTATION=
MEAMDWNTARFAVVTYKSVPAMWWFTDMLYASYDTSPMTYAHDTP